MPIFLYAKSEQYAERSSRVEDIYVFPVNTLNQYDEGFIAEGSCLSFLCHDGQSFFSFYLNVLTMYCWSSSGDGVNFSLLNVSFYALYISLEYYSTLVALSSRTLKVVLCLHRKNHQKKNITVYVHQKGHLHSQEFIHQAFFFQLLTKKKKSCDLVTTQNNLGKLIIYHFWPLFVTKINFFAVRIPEHGVYSSPPMKMWNAFHSSKTWVHFK